MQAHKTTGLAALAVALLYATTPLVHAQEVAGEPAAGIATPYASGGIGKDEAAAMRKAGKDFDLRVEFSGRKDNEFVADANLVVTDLSGASVFALADAGPIVNVELPAGRYRVSASWHGRTETRLVSLDGKGGADGKDLFFHWQAQSPGQAMAQLQGASDE